MKVPVICYAVFHPTYKEGKVATFSWLGWSEEEVRARMVKVGMNEPLYEVKPVQAYQVAVDDLWRFPVGGPYEKTPWVKVLDVDKNKQQYGQTTVLVLLCEDNKFESLTSYRTTLPEAYLMLYAEFVETISREQ